MYVIFDPHPADACTADQQQRYETTRTAANRVFGAVQREYVRATELDTRGDDEPLTAIERLELASLCATLAGAFAHAADTWDSYRSNLPVAVAYRQQATDLQDADALNTALADIAPAADGGQFQG